MRRPRTMALSAAGVALVLAGTSAALAATGNMPLGQHLVGRQADASFLTPDNQFLTPAGTRIKQSGRPMATALSPDGLHAANLTWDGTGLVTILEIGRAHV